MQPARAGGGVSLPAARRVLVLRDRFRTDWASQRLRAAAASWFARQPVPKDLCDRGLADEARAHLLACWQALDAKVGRLVLEDRAEGTAVRFADTLVFLRERDTGVIRAWKRLAPGQGKAVPHDIDLRFPMAMDEWWAAILTRHVVLPERFAFGPGGSGEVEMPGFEGLANHLRQAWMHRVLSAFARKVYDTRALGDALRQQVGVEPAVVSLALALWPGSGAPVCVDARLYALAVRHFKGLREIHEKAPAALKLAGGLLLDDEHRVDPVDPGWVREQMALQGLGRAAWKRLLRIDSRPFWQSMAKRDGGFTPEDWAALRLWLRLHELLPRKPWMVAALWRVLHPNRADFAGLHRRSAEIPDGFLRRAAKRFSEARPDGRSRVLADVATLVHWMIYTREGDPQALTRGWSVMLDKAREDGRRRVARRADEYAVMPRAPLQRFTQDGLEARAIESRAELAEAAITLRNCADALADEDMARHLMFYAVFDATGRCVGMAGYFVALGIFMTHDVRETFNRSAGPRLSAFAEALRLALVEAAARKPTVIVKKRPRWRPDRPG